MSGTAGWPVHLLKHVGETDGGLWWGMIDSWLGSDFVGEFGCWDVVLLLLLLLLLLVGAGEEIGGE